MLVDNKAVAAYFGVSVQTLDRWADPRARVTAAEVKRWLAEDRVSSDDHPIWVSEHEAAEFFLLPLCDIRTWVRRGLPTAAWKDTPSGQLFDLKGCGEWLLLSDSPRPSPQRLRQHIARAWRESGYIA